ncbi:MAG: hypothetical protein RIS36_1088 [Pseudomonadota bacterium]|jgi:hypothetical protein
MTDTIDHHDEEESQAHSEGPAKQDLVGGFAFFLSLAALLPTGLMFTTLTFLRLETANSTTTANFIFAALAGAAIAQMFIRGHLSVFIHEFKHSLISNLVGNRHKGMKIGERSGHYQYAYTKSTAHYNAFISLAPYITPVFTFISVVIALLSLREDRELAAIVVGVGYGMDILLNMRDISPIQTDISLIRGGYNMGLAYIAAWNLLLAGLVFAWAFHGVTGLSMLLEDISSCFIHLYIALFGDPRQ